MLTATGEHPASTVRGLEVNTIADGFFHVATWLLVVAGSSLMLRSWRQGRRPLAWPVHVGMLIAGWGVFNLVEGTVNHLLLGIHHVRDDSGGPLAWDLAFLGLGAAQLVIGLALARRAKDPGRK